jgi:DNA polymerase III delta prime subunit
MNELLGRELIAQNIKQILADFDNNCTSVTYKKGIYIYGSPGCGKTYFITNLLKELDYDIIQYDAGDVRNKALIDTLTSNNISNRNVLQMMKKKVKKIAIVMDEVDGMNNGDKGGITSLIKLIRQKKTKKQKSENVTMNPIICIGNYNIDKKIKELMKVCNVYELKPVTNFQIDNLLKNCIQSLQYNNFQNSKVYEQIINYIQGDLRKLYFIQNIILKKPELLNNSGLFSSILQCKSHHDDSKIITKLIINKPIPITRHTQFMNETERTIVALLFHENIIDPIFSSKIIDNRKKYEVYSKLMKNVCYADHIDRITFQNQIWIFNEMSSLIKTFHNNQIYHDAFPSLREMYNPDEVRFTKVLTKYSTEYNNQTFTYNLCQELDMDKKDIMSFFQEKRLFFKNDYLLRVEKLLEETAVTKLDVRRIYRYLDKNIKPEIEDNILDD